MDALLFGAAALFVAAASLLALVAFLGADPFAAMLFYAAFAAAGALLLVLLAAVARSFGRRPSRAAARACTGAVIAASLGFLLNPTVAIARRELAEWRADGVVADIEERAAFCAGREAERIPTEEPYPLDPRPRYREAVERCVTEDGRFREFPNGPHVTCYSASCSVDLSYLDTYPALDNRSVDLEPFMNDALVAAGAGPYRQTLTGGNDEP